jgi:sugar phosphate isomerase/epimerase
MQDHGIKFGLEYLGMRTMLNQNRYPFISTMEECRDLIATTGQRNVGFVLDSFHWYCANENIEDIRSLSPSEVVVVDINDARSGFTRETQVDGKRELPLATGVIDLKSFLQGLVDIGYDGPVRTEPFNQELNKMDDAPALQTNMKAIRKALALLG